MTGDDAGVPCSPGQVESEACPDGGERTRMCVEGTWGPWSACMALGPCDGEGTEERACGPNSNGVESRACVDGTWTVWGPCEGADACREGSTDDEACGVEGNGTRTRTCVGGAWSEFGPCDDPDQSCVDGEVETVACGLNGRGMQSHTCVDGRFGPFDECRDPDVCVDGDENARPCGLNGNGAETQECLQGVWSPYGACVDTDECENGARALQECGFNERGLQSRLCAEGRWSEFGACEDPDVCVDGAEVESSCGLNERGVELGLCVEGQLTPLVDCIDPDECVDGGEQELPCGRGGIGRRNRQCDAGQWSGWSRCEGAPECPDPGNADCAERRPERCNGFDDDGDGEVDEGFLFEFDGEPPERRFIRDVERAIVRGIDALRQLEARRGNINDDQARSNFLAVLAFLERQERAERGPRNGFLSLPEQDRALVVRLVAAMMAQNECLWNGAARPYIYTAGGDLMALARYLEAGGPDDVGADLLVSEAIALCGASVIRMQGFAAPDNLGGWNYTTPNASGDLSTTHYAMSGLIGARRFVPGADEAIANVIGLLNAAQNEDGGFPYRPGNDTSTSMTAFGVWALLATGQQLDDPRVQRGMAWLAENHTVSQLGSFVGTSDYVALWYLTRALGATVRLDDPRFRFFEPEAVGYPEETGGYYFDIAYRLMTWQDAQGRWGTQANGSSRGWTAESSHMFALLALERALSGVGANVLDLGGIPQCSDEQDNDGDGLVDADDPDCVLACTPYEGPSGSCVNGLDDDRDGLIDRDDLGCLLGDEARDPACANGVDDDQDGLVDWPDDPNCTNRLADDESGPGQFACSNGEDDDRDGAIDMADPDCLTAIQETERGVLECDVDFVYRLAPSGYISGELPPGEGEVRAFCGDTQGREAVVALVVDTAATVTLSTHHAQTMARSTIYVRSQCLRGDIDCAAPDDDGHARLRLDLEPGVYFVYVDTAAGGAWHLSINARFLRPDCGDSADNDGDGAVDLLDVGCESLVDGSEVDPEGLPACADGRDNDEDGLVDFPFDPGCEGPGGAREADPDGLPVCNNGLDDDRDGLVDLLDPNCLGAGWESEDGVLGECSNGQDDDGDGVTDFPFDSGCRFAGDVEDNPAVVPACSNGEDDDGDGIIDFRGEPGCASAGDDDEEDPEILPVCGNGDDDDGDGLADFPRDPGCSHAGDLDEADPNPMPQCADGMDNDGDGRSDFPDDPGCLFAADDDEAHEGALLPRCSDGIDNDLDGEIDGADLGCVDAADDDESDPGDIPLCGNEVDDDGDGFVDYPEDPGCTGRGDVNESQQCSAIEPLFGGTGRNFNAQTFPGDFDRFSASCGGEGAPEHVYRYETDERGPLRVRVEGQREFAPVVSIRRNCDVADSEIACVTGDEPRAPRVIFIEDAEPGEYYIVIDGTGGLQWSSRGEEIEFGDPRAFVSRRDVREGCGWADGGNDAFDCFGRTLNLVHAGEGQALNPAPGIYQHRAGDYAFQFTSDFAGTNTWRMRFEPSVAGDDRPVDITLQGNLGSDGSTQAWRGEVNAGGAAIPYTVTSDAPAAGQPRDPRVVHMVVPSSPEELENVTIDVNRDNVTYQLTQVTLPVTFYVAIGYQAPGSVATMLAEDVRVRGGEGGGAGLYMLRIERP